MDDFMNIFPRSPFKWTRQSSIMGRILEQVEQVWNRQKRPHLFHFEIDIIHLCAYRTGGTGEIKHNTHARTRTRARYFLTFILIIIKNTCSLVPSHKIIKHSPVPSACSYLFHLFQTRRVFDA